jgi:hypothetical protein
VKQKWVLSAYRLQLTLNDLLYLLTALLPTGLVASVVAGPAVPASLLGCRVAAHGPITNQKLKNIRG